MSSDAIANLLEAVSILIAALSFAYGVNAWRREHIGKRKIELSETVLSLFYEARDKIREIRNPFSSGGEGKSRTPSPSETQEETTLLNRAYIVIERFEARKETFNKINTIKYQFMAVYGRDKEAHFNELNAIVVDIFGASTMLGQVYWPRQGRAPMTKEEFEAHLKKMHDAEAIFWRGYEKEDPIDGRIDDLIKKVEEEMRSSISVNWELMERGVLAVAKTLLRL